MSRILVSIVSSQTVPNYLFIKEWQDKVDKFLFISTRQMENQGKTKAICSTAGIDKKQRKKILIDENELHLTAQKLDRLGWRNAGHTFLVNLTGGTKLMSIAVFEYFKQLDSRFFYLPITGNKYLEIFPDRVVDEHEIHYGMGVKEYLGLHDIDCEFQPLHFSSWQIQELYKDARSTSFSLEHFPRKKLTQFHKGEVTANLMTRWYEEYLYHRIKEVLELPDHQITAGVKLFDRASQETMQHYMNDNELDVLFVYKNNAYIVEAKYRIGEKKININTMNQYIFKLAAIMKRFGIKARAVLFTHADLSQLSHNVRLNLENRCSLVGVDAPVDRQIIDDDNMLRSTLFKMINQI